jgi:hypothetical protein
MATVEDMPAEAVDAILEAWPGPVGICAHFPLERDHVLLVVARRDLVLVLGIDAHVHHDVRQRVGRREVSTRLSVHVLDRAAHENGIGVHGLCIQDRRPLGIDEHQHVENGGREGRRVASAAGTSVGEVAVDRLGTGRHGRHEHQEQQDGAHGLRLARQRHYSPQRW